ncbi:hypothetical protein FDECE_18694, partial [Fusarium decemcellulare]
MESLRGLPTGNITVQGNSQTRPDVLFAEEVHSMGCVVVTKPIPCRFCAMEAITDEKRADTLQSDLVGKDDSETDSIQWTEEEEKRLLRKSVALCDDRD